jgi:hypothetical protein
MASALRRVNAKVEKRSCARVLLSGAATAISIFSFVAQIGSAHVNAANPAAQPGTVRVDTTPGRAINSFDPDSALGSSIDSSFSQRHQ